MKMLFLLLLLLPGYFCAAQNKVQETTHLTDSIFWRPDYKLQARDYKGTPEPGSRFGAVSIFPIICHYETDSITQQLRFRVYSFFDIKASWIKAENRNDKDLLEHEQVHFDIVEIYVRIIKQRIREYQRQGKKKEEDYVSLINALLDEEEQAQQHYDEETDLSRNEAQQKRWAGKVKALLRQKDIRQFK